MALPRRSRAALVLAIGLFSILAGGATRIVQDQCGPFTDVTPAFCPHILELYYLGITAGTSATTFSPDKPLTRGQAAVFVAKGLNQSVVRSSRRAALGQWWNPSSPVAGLGTTTLSDQPFFCVADGEDIWVGAASSVTRVHASDGRVLGTWTGAINSLGIVAAMGRVFIAGQTQGGLLYMIDPSQPPGEVAVVATGLGSLSLRMAFDGSRLWVTDLGGSIAIITPAATTPWPVTHVTSGFVSLSGIAFDGSHMWVVDTDNEQPRAGRILELDPDGNVLLTVPVGNFPHFPVFDGANIWVPNGVDGSVSVVQAATGTVVTTLIGNGMVSPLAAAFDGSRILIIDASPGASLWRAADLSPLGVVSTSNPSDVCSDGLNFWVTLISAHQLARL
ncbi:MAG: S-layer homology domain-containing protein [Thermoanaerobaculia bacterium]